MLFVLSPAKTLDYTSPIPAVIGTPPAFQKRAAELVSLLRAISPADLASLMTISDQLAQLNAQRFTEWSVRNSRSNSRPAVLAFDGDVYDGLQARSMTPTQLLYLQSHLRILSGLYGLLRPLDSIQPHRLEMSTRLANTAGANLYAFWGDAVTAKLRSALIGKEQRTIVNLASEEYFKAVRPTLLKANVITPVFEDWHEGRYRVISFFAKRARGAMVRYAATRAIVAPHQLQDFRGEDYAFDAASSDVTTWRFRRAAVSKRDQVKPTDS
ncbi:MAG: peroxide stress protein YaaA [Pseudomonadota bacterium]